VGSREIPAKLGELGFRVAFWILTMTVLAGCAVVKKPVDADTMQEGGLLMMVYGRGSSSPDEDQNDDDEHRMTVHVTQSDSTFDFGHITGDNNFNFYCTGREGRFRIRGGEVRQFAIRVPDDAHRVYGLEAYGTCYLTGPEMNPEWAIYPLMDDPYYSIAVLTFLVSRNDTVTVELVASSPNGFDLLE
jgi:hypothetical protein